MCCIVTVQSHIPEPKATNNPIGQLFYIPHYSLATDELTGGVQLFNVSKIRDCYINSTQSEMNTKMTIRKAYTNHLLQKVVLVGKCQHPFHLEHHLMY